MKMTHDDEDQGLDPSVAGYEALTEILIEKEKTTRHLASKGMDLVKHLITSVAQDETISKQNRQITKLHDTINELRKMLKDENFEKQQRITRLCEPIEDLQLLSKKTLVSKSSKTPNKQAKNGGGKRKKTP